jgi:molybdopterin-synthase adenylyltransferase
MIVIVGVGALGSHLALAIRNLDVPLRLIDMDRVETRNTLSQAYPRQSVGKNKAAAMQQLMLLYGAKVEAIPHRLVQNNQAAMLGSASLIVDCVDNQETRLLIKTFAATNSIPCLHGAVDRDGSFGRVGWDPDFRIDPDPAGPQQPTCEDGRHLPFLYRVSSYLADAVQRHVRDGVQVSYNIFPQGVLRI